MDQATDARGLVRREPLFDRLLQVMVVAGRHRPTKAIRQQFLGQARSKARIGGDGGGEVREAIDGHPLGSRR